jgi:hypothetical protein
VFFANEAADASVYLTADIILHFQTEKSRAISLIFNNYSYLTQPDAYGVPAFRLDVAEWPVRWQESIWEMLAQSPLNEWIHLTSYHPSHKQGRIPLITVQSTALSVV